MGARKRELGQRLPADAGVRANTGRSGEVALTARCSTHKRKFGISSEGAIFDPVIELLFPALPPPNPFKLHLAPQALGTARA